MVLSRSWQVVGADMKVSGSNQAYAQDFFSSNKKIHHHN
jgi:hypothetical protein